MEPDDKRLKNLKPFSKENQPKNPGRKKKIYTILKEKGYSKEDTIAAFGEMAYYSVPELKKLHADRKQPVIVRIVANQYYQALVKGDFAKIKEIMEYSIGKPLQTIEEVKKQTIEISYEGVNDED